MRLHVGSAILAWMKDQWGRPDRPLLPGMEMATTFTGIPIVEEAGFPGGRWELRDGDVVVKREQIGPDHGQMYYSPPTGFVHFAVSISDGELTP